MLFAMCTGTIPEELGKLIALEGLFCEQQQPLR